MGRWAESKTVCADQQACHLTVLLARQAQFIRLFPFERLKDRLTADDLRKTVAEISSRHTAQFIGMLTIFLYWYHIAHKGARSVEKEQLSQLFCAIQQVLRSIKSVSQNISRSRCFLYSLVLQHLLHCIASSIAISTSHTLAQVSTVCYLYVRSTLRQCATACVAGARC